MALINQTSDKPAEQPKQPYEPPKIVHFSEKNGERLWILMCPACQQVHVFDKRWKFNGDMEHPTFTGSMAVNKGNPKTYCHAIIAAGKWNYQNDCGTEHPYKGRMIPCEPF